MVWKMKRAIGEGKNFDSKRKMNKAIILTGERESLDQSEKMRRAIFLERRMWEWNMKMAIPLARRRQKWNMKTAILLARRRQNVKYEDGNPFSKEKANLSIKAKRWIRRSFYQGEGESLDKAKDGEGNHLIKEKGKSFDNAKDGEGESLDKAKDGEDNPLIKEKASFSTKWKTEKAIL